MPSSNYNDYSPVAESYMLSQSRRERTWVNTPGYPLDDPDDMPVNPYFDFQISGTSDRTEMLRVSKSDGNVVKSYFQWPKQNDTLGGFVDYAGSGLTSDDELFNEALIKCLKKASDSKANLGVMFAEKVKTSDLILQKASQVYKAYRQARKGDFKGAARTLNLSPKTIHKSWLEMTYGWTPLVMEVYNAAEFLAQRFTHEKPIRFSVSSKLKARRKNVDLAPGGFNRTGFGNPDYEWAKYESDATREVRVKLDLEISNPHLQHLQQLGMTNPALVAWELVPFSFVFDWFISVGDYLNALTALHGITVKKAMKSSSFYGSASCTETFIGYSGLYDIYPAWSGSRRMRFRRYKRDPFTVNVTNLRPTTDFSIPHWRRVVSGLALMRSAAAS